MSNTPSIPITILTGFLGAGKTTLLLSLLPQLPAGYKLCLLKNEFGDVAIDSKLAQQGAVTGVTELLNGCICCNLVGQLEDALLTLKDNYKPTRIVIETSGSAFPATLAMEVNRISSENGGIFMLDGVIQVVDVENWAGYADTSYTAKLQAKYTDLIVLNKHEVAGAARLEEVMDRIRDVAEETPVVRTASGWINKDVIFGLDSSFTRDFTIEKISERAEGHDHEHSSEVDVLSLTLPAATDDDYVDASVLESLLLAVAPKDEVYRIKGILRFRLPPPQHPDSPFTSADTPTTPPVGNRWALNWAFGRWRFTPLRESSVVTTIEGSTPAPDCPVAQSSPLKQRKGSIEVMVQTSIKTVVEEKTGETTECAKLNFVLAHGEGNRWKRKLETTDIVRYDRKDAEGVVVVEQLA